MIRRVSRGRLIAMRWLFPDDARAIERRDRILRWLFLASCALLVARAARKETGVLRLNQQFGARFLAGEDPYFDPARGARVHGPYPPTLVWVAAPLARLPTPAARVAWALVQVGALAALLAVTRRWTSAFSARLAPHFPVLFAAALLLSARYLLRDTAGGGANVVHAALAVLAIDLAARGREGLAGLAFAFSLATKPYLAPLALLFVARARWRTLAATAGFGLALFALPALHYGAGRWVDLTAGWARGVAGFLAADDPRIAAEVPAGLPVEDTTMNQSLAAALRRALPPESAALATALARLLALAALATAFVAARRTRGPLAGAAAALAFLPACLLASPVAWKAHHVLLLPLFHVLACAAFLSERRARWTAALAAYWLVCGLLSEEVVGRAGKVALERASVVAWGDLALRAAALAVALRREPFSTVPGTVLKDSRGPSSVR